MDDIRSKAEHNTIINSPPPKETRQTCTTTHNSRTLQAWSMRHMQQNTIFFVPFFVFSLSLFDSKSRIECILPCQYVCVWIDDRTIDKRYYSNCYSRTHFNLLVSLLLRFPHMCSGVWNMVSLNDVHNVLWVYGFVVGACAWGNFRHLKSTQLHAYIQINCSRFAALSLTARKTNIFTHRLLAVSSLIVLVYWYMLNAWLASAGS